VLGPVIARPPAPVDVPVVVTTAAAGLEVLLEDVADGLALAEVLTEADGLAELDDGAGLHVRS
jgi:hypothetical protein